MLMALVGLLLAAHFSGNVIIVMAGLTLATMLLAATPALGRRAMAGGVAALLAWGGVGLWRLSAPPPSHARFDLSLCMPAGLGV